MANVMNTFLIFQFFLHELHELSRIVFYQIISRICNTQGFNLNILILILNTLILILNTPILILFQLKSLYFSSLSFW